VPLGDLHQWQSLDGQAALGQVADVDVLPLLREDDGRSFVQVVQVQWDRLRRQRQQQLNRVAVRVDRLLADPDLVKVVAAANARAIILEREDVEAGASQRQGKSGTAGFDTLTGVAADHDAEVVGGLRCHRPYHTTAGEERIRKRVYIG